MCVCGRGRVRELDNSGWERDDWKLWADVPGIGARVWAVGESTYEVLVNADGSVDASDEWCAGSGASSHTSTRSCAPIAGRIASGDDGKGATLGRV